MSQKFSSRRILIALVFAVLGLGVTAKADVVYLGTVESQGNGIGAGNTILTLQNNGLEQGCVGRALGVDVTCSQDEKTGAGQTLTRTLAELGVSDGTQLRIIFNLNETGNQGDVSRFITLQQLHITIWNGDTLVATFQCSNCQDSNFLTLNQADSGIGGSGHAFGLDAAQAAQLTALIGLHGTGLRVGIIAKAGCAAQTETADCRKTDDGPDVFQATNATAPVPEPASMLLLGTGLAGVAAGIRRRRRNGK